MNIFYILHLFLFFNLFNGIQSRIYDNKNVSTIVISQDIPNYILLNTVKNKTKNKKKKKEKEKEKETQLHSLTLTNDNFILLKGPIDKKTTNAFLYEFNLMPNKTNIYLYIDSPGGSVEDGNKILNEVQKFNIKCIAERAYSMAFAIFQGCSMRYIVPFGKLMQHQISFGIQNEKAKIENYIEFINQIENQLVFIQSSKIGLTQQEFKEKTYNEWWIFGQNIIQQKCADEMIHIECTPQLTSENYTLSERNYDYIYSKCPLINTYIDKVKKEKTEDKGSTLFDFLLD